MINPSLHVQDCQTLRCKSTPEIVPALPSLDSLALFMAMRPRTQEALRKQARKREVAKGDILFLYEDPAQAFYFVESGWVKLYRETLDGDEAVLDVLPPGAIFGETAPYEDGVYAYSAEVIEEGRILSFPLDILAREVKENNDFAVAFLKHMAGKGLARDKDIELRAVQNAPQRIGCFLLRLCRGAEKNSATLHLPWEKALLAARLGMTPETLSRAFARLQKDIGLRIRGATIEVPDIRALARYTCTACSNIFPCNN